MNNWEKEFDEKYKETYCVDCLRGSWKRDHIKSFIRANFIEKEKVREVLSHIEVKWIGPGEKPEAMKKFEFVIFHLKKELLEE